MADPVRLPPQNIEAEQSVIGSCLLDANAALKSAEILPNAGDFYRETHQTIYNCILELMEKGVAVDILTVSEALRKREDFERVGGAEYLTGLLNVIPSTGNVEHYAKIIREKAVLRSLIHAGGTISDLGFREDESADTLLDKSEAIIFNIAQKRILRDFDPLKDTLHKAYEKISDLYARKSQVTGIPTHFKDFDYMTAGLQNSDLLILAARPGMGKTALALNIALNVAVNEKLPVAVFSLEMSKEQLAMRLLCSQGRIDSQALRTGWLKESDWPKLTRAFNDLVVAPIYLDDTPNQSVLEMRSKARRLQKNYGLQLLIIDYIQLVRGTSLRQENRTTEVSEISRQLKGLAKELNIPIICISQLSRSCESRNDKRPMLSDLRESGAIEQDADMVMFIYRDSYYNKDIAEDDNTAELDIAKHRHGPTGKVKLAFLGQYARFENMEKYVEQ